MLIFPAIDLKDGQVVRLYRGDFATVHQVAEDPVSTARTFYEAGARYLHMVDLDGARDGVRKNAAIVRAVRTEPSLASMPTAIRSGPYRSTAARTRSGLLTAVERYGPDRIAVGIDAKDGSVRTAGWVEDAGLDCLDFARQMEAAGVEHIIFTDIDTDGTLSGPAFSRLEALGQAVGCAITASGGVSSNADLRALRDLGLYAAIVGKAWYAGAVDLAQAVREGGPQV